LLLFYFCCYCYIISSPVVVCSVEVAVVGVSVKHKRDDYVSNLYILEQKNGFQGINESEFLMVTKKLLLSSLTMVLFVGFYLIFAYKIVIDSFYLL